MRKVITLLARVCATLGLSEWRQSAYNIRKLKRLYRKAQSLKRSQAKKKERVEQKRERIARAHRAYTDVAEAYLEKAKATLEVLAETNRITAITYDRIKPYIRHAERQIDQTRRRVLKGERIPHQEKVFSIFEEHTEWISKGKAGVPVELGLRVCIVKDQYNFILHHNVMQGETDDKIAVSIIEETQSRFPDFRSCSFDMGFHSPVNQKELSLRLDRVTLPRKGRLSAINKEIENSEEFKKARRTHSAVESSINALQNHGLERCPDHGIDGFKRYVALAVVARNIQILGNLLQQKELKSLGRKEKKAQKAA